MYRRYVSGSPSATVSISGDVLGSIFPNGEPDTLQTMFPLAKGRFGKGTEYHTFQFATNIWHLHYLRLTNQWKENRDLTKDVFNFANVEYTAILRRLSSRGWFSNWDDAEPSVWLTSWVVQQLSYASFQAWEDFLYIHSKVAITSV